MAELWVLAKNAEQFRVEREAGERTRQEIERRKQHETYLETLAADFDRCWNTIHQHAERCTASAYDKAARAIADLAEAYVFTSDRNTFDDALRRFMVRHAKRGALVRRLVEAGLWRK